MHKFKNNAAIPSLMELRQMLEKLRNSNEFKLWQKNHSGYYLAHVFVMIDNANEGIWQAGYYNPLKDKMVTFIVSPEEITVTPEQEVMKANKKIAELDIEKVKLSVEEAIDISKKCIKEHYKNELLMKSFFIIQELDGITMFNITYLTKGFKTINIRINSIDGKVVKHTSGVIAEFS